MFSNGRSLHGTIPAAPGIPGTLPQPRGSGTHSACYVRYFTGGRRGALYRITVRTPAFHQDQNQRDWDGSSLFSLVIASICVTR